LQELAIAARAVARNQYREDGIDPHFGLAEINLRRLQNVVCD
jgi:hypothetical protein